jgi:hypothetical protein
MMPPIGLWDIDRLSESRARMIRSESHQKFHLSASNVSGGKTQEDEDRVDRMSISQNENGSFRGTFIFQECGFYILRVRLFGRAVCEPLEVRVRGEFDDLLKCVPV